MSFESPDHALRRYAALCRQLSEPSGYDPAAIRKRCKALVCKTCEKGKIHDGQKCQHRRARWIEWDEWVLKGGSPMGTSRKLTVRPKSTRGRRGPGGSDALLELATLGARFARVGLWQRRVLWLYVVEGLSYRDIAEFGRERWPRSTRVSWNKDHVASLVRQGRNAYARKLGRLIAA